MKTLDIERLAKEVRKSKEDRGYPDTIPSMKGYEFQNIDYSINYNLSLLREYLNKMHQLFQVTAADHDNNVLKRIIKRIIIRLSRFYIMPIVEVQNIFNDTVKETDVQLYEYAKQQSEQIKIMQKKIQRLEEEIDQIKK